MPKKKQESKFGAGYSAWTKKKLIKEATNVARWDPWIAHNWMTEAARGLSIEDFDLVEFHDVAADKINNYWINLRKMRYYNSKVFWKSMPPKLITKIISDDDYDII
tara:strand:- start:211 stop:528 length:318 start_codon:yes stop_codon:yes gene_type:complete